ncbi:MAG: hypothetical protein KAG18_00910 [Sinobacterium sp.]|nr:hypothetical protein [Sinobacterium sp.]
MVSIKQLLTTSAITATLFITACVPQSPKEETQEVDIYAAFNEDRIEYADGTVEGEPEQDSEISEASPTFVKDQLKAIRLAYFKRQYVDAGDMAENLIRLDSQLAEAYYWLARVRLDQSDYYQAHEMASKGLSVIDPSDEALVRELERIQGISQMGN